MSSGHSVTHIRTDYFISDFFFGKFEKPRTFDGVPDLIEYAGSSVHVYRGKLHKNGDVTFSKKPKKTFDLTNFFESNSFASRLDVDGDKKWDKIVFAPSLTESNETILRKQMSREQAKKLWDMHRIGFMDMNKDGKDDMFTVVQNPADKTLSYSVDIAALAQRPGKINPQHTMMQALLPVEPASRPRVVTQR